MAILDMNTTIADEQKKFIETIYHDARGGSGMRVILRDDQKPLEYVTKNLDKLRCHDQTKNIYISLATHTGCRRIESQLFNRSVMYVDIDPYMFKADETEELKENIIKKLNSAFASKTLPVPTMVTDSGRGIGVYYCLDRSIAVTERTVKQMSYFKLVYEMLYEAYEWVIGDTAKLDHAVLDSSRIARLPGTINQKVGKLCRLIYYKEGGYYSISDIRASILETLADKRKKENKKPSEKNFTRVISFEGAKNCGFLFTRINRLTTLARLRVDQSDGFRELLLFVAYNAAARVYDAQTARNVIYDINSEFKCPLGNAEVEHVFRSAERKGLYNYSDKRIIATLGISEIENRHCHFGNGYGKESKRREIREHNQKTKEMRNTEITKLISENSGISYKEIAGSIGVSEVTVKRIANKAGVYRYACARKGERNTEAIDIVTAKQKRDNERQKETDQCEVMVCDDKGWTSLESTMPTKVSFFAPISKDVPFDDNPFLSDEEKEEMFSRWADEPDWWKKYLALCKRNVSPGKVMCKIANYISSVKVARNKKALDAEVVEIVRSNDDLTVIENLLKEWWMAHDPEPARIVLAKKRSERYKQLLVEWEARSAEKYEVLEKRFENAKLSIQVTGIPEKYYWQLRRYYFTIFKAAKAGRSFYSLKSGCDATGTEVVSRLLTLTADDFVGIAKQTYSVKCLYHEFSWYLNQFMAINLVA